MLTISGALAWIAHIGFWVLIVIGWTMDELGGRALCVLLGLWLVACLGVLTIPFVPFSSIVALLDVALVFMVFKGDIRLH